MYLLRSFKGLPSNQNLTRLKLVLFLSFSILMLFQFLAGFRDLEDYLIVFIFVLFLNDLYLKIKKPETIPDNNKRRNRLIMSVFFLLLFSLPFIIDTFNVSNAIRLTIYKLGFVLWAQVFLIDSFLHYKKTHSKQWLLFANTAVLLIIIGSFVS